MIKFLTRIFKLLVWAIASLYFVAVVLTHIPVVQERLGAEVSALLAEELETYVSVRNVNLGFLNRVVIEDVEIKDKQKETLIKAKTIAVTPDFFDILKGKITLISAQLFGADVKLYKKTEDGELNCQFIVDKLSNPENKEPSKLDLRINTLIVRNSAVSYDLNYLPKKHSGVVDFNHIRLTGINSNLVLYQLKGDNIDLAIKRLAFKEAKAFDLQNLTCDFTKSKAAIALKNVDLKLADGKLLSDSLVYDFEQKTVRGDIDAEYKDLAVSAYVSGSKEQILVERMQLHNAVNSLLVKGNGAVNQLPSGNVQWRADIADSNIDVQELKRTVFELTGSNINLTKALEEARFIAFSGKTDGVLEQGFKNNPLLKINGNIDGDIKSGFGDIALNLAKTPEKIVAKFNTDKLLLGKILADSRFSVLSADMETSVPVATLASLMQGFELEKLQDLAVKGEVKQFDYDGKTFKNIVANLTLSNNVLVGKLNVAPQNIASFDADIDLNMSALKEKKLTGKLKLENLSYEKYHLAQVVADFNGDEANIKTDLADINLRGDIDKKNLDSDIHIYDMAQVDKFLNLGTVTKGAVDANLHLLGDSLFGDIMSEQLTVSSFDLRDVDVQFSKKGNRIESVVKTATGSQHSTFNSQESVLKVNLHSAVNLLQNDKGGISGANVHIMPSQIFVKDTLFRVSESDVVYDNNVLVINNLKVQHDDQHVIINGRADRNSNDSIEADISNIDVPYILNFVKFSAVSFTGKANGHAVVKKLFSKPEANAMLTVDNFTFEEGRMGTLYASATWNNEDTQIDINALCDDEGRETLINGYVSPKHNYIDLAIQAQNTRGEFVANYCKSFLSDAELSCTGKCRLWGDLSYINLTGLLYATGKMHVKSLGTDYTLRDQLVELVPNDILFPSDTIVDKYGHIGVVTGALHHQYLSRLTYDIAVQPQNMLCYDFSTYGNEIFFGKAFCTGKCDIIGRPGNITFNINAKVEKGSFVEYNASNPDAITGQQFIKWNDRTISKINTQWSAVNDGWDDYPSDIRMNITATVDPQSTLRVLIDSRSHDLITLHGSGDLRATYYNKGKFQLFGNYAVSSGTYKMTIQNLIQKNFQFQDGSHIVFGGEPYEAALTLKAKYPINGVPLSDLQIGNSFKNNNVHVDCLMDITGTPEQPVVDFDLDIPTINADAKAMINSLLNSEQEKKQQVLYLLAIGRFYSQQSTANNQQSALNSQASLAMQSFLSGTISQQINNALQSIINSQQSAVNQQWTLGANISPGDEGLYNAEYEGLLSGSLFNNRLLVNGQFGYRDNPNSSSNFIGDFDVRYLLLPNGNIAVRVYNQTNDRYFTRSSLNTQGLGMIFKYDFQRIFTRKRKNFLKRVGTIKK